MILCGIVAACSKMQETGTMCPIGFRAEAGVQTSTKAAGTPLTDFVSSFTVAGTEMVGGSGTSLFGNGYAVNYNNGWYYKDINSQELKYWNFKASEYRFSAFTVGSAAGGTLTVNGATSSGNNFIALEKDNTVEPEQFGQTVDLQFSRLLSRIRVAFYEDMEDWEVKNVRYSLSGTFVNRGDYSIDLADGSFSASNISSDPRIGGTIEGTIGDSVETAAYENFTEVLPFHNLSGITLTLHSYTYADPIGGEEYVFSPETEVAIPAAKAAWDLNHSYTYIFRISEARVTLNMTIDLSIHDWQNINNETILE